MLRVTVFASILLVSSFLFAQTTVSSRTKSFPPARMVAQVELVGKTEGVADTVLFTPEADGLFRVSAYAAPTAAPQGSCDPNIGVENLFSALRWSDDANPVEVIDLLGITFVLPGTNYDQKTVVIHATANTPVTYTILINFNQSCVVTQPGRYNFFITAERLF